MTSINIKYHAIATSDIPEVLKFVEDAYYQGDVHFLDYDKESVDNVINNKGPKKYTRTSEEDILQMIENKNGTLIGARIDNNDDKDGEIVACAFVEKCDLKYAKDICYADNLGNLKAPALTPIGLGCRVCERANCQHRGALPSGQNMRFDLSKRYSGLFDSMRS